MRDELLGYYERELSFFRQMGAEFAEKYPKIAGRLQLEPDTCEDPHVERLIEAFAFLASRVHLKVDDEFPEITESLLNVLYPHLLAPIPSMSIVQFVLDPSQVSLQSGQRIPRGAMLYSRSVAGTSCRFRTAYPVHLWPLEMRQARFELPIPGVGPEEGVRTVLRLELKTFGGSPLRELKEKVSESEEKHLESLRFYLQGEGKVVYALHELIHNHLVAVELRPGGPRDVPSPVKLPKSVVSGVGFERDEGLLPYTDRSFLGYRLLAEYFAFPEKFFFFDVKGLEQAAREDFDDGLEILLYFNRDFPLERNVSAQTFRLNCTPVANLFRQIAEPIRLTHLQPEYRVIPDVRRQDVTEVYSVEGVTSVAQGERQGHELRALLLVPSRLREGAGARLLVHEPAPLGAQGRRRDRRLPLARRPRVQPGPARGGHPHRRGRLHEPGPPVAPPLRGGRGRLPARRSGRLLGDPLPEAPDAHRPAPAPPGPAVAAPLPPLAQPPLARRAGGRPGARGAPGDPPPLRLLRLLRHPPADCRDHEGRRRGASSARSGSCSRAS